MHANIFCNNKKHIHRPPKIHTEFYVFKLTLPPEQFLLVKIKQRLDDQGFAQLNLAIELIQ